MAYTCKKGKKKIKEEKLQMRSESVWEHFWYEGYVRLTLPSDQVYLKGITIYESIIRAYASYVEFGGNRESKDEMWASYVACLILSSGDAFGVLYLIGL